jgi:hypothetical protein
VLSNHYTDVYEILAFLRLPMKKAIKTINTSAPKAAPTMIGIDDGTSISSEASALQSIAILKIEICQRL